MLYHLHHIYIYIDAHSITHRAHRIACVWVGVSMFLDPFLGMDMDMGHGTWIHSGVGICH